MIIMVINLTGHVDITVFPDHILGDLVADYFLCSCHNEIMVKTNSLLLFSEMHSFCIWKLTCSVRLVLMQHVDNSSKKSWRATVLQEDIWARRLKAIREDEAEEWGDHKGVVTLLTSLSDAGNLSWMRPNCSKTDWNWSSFWGKVQKVH